MDNHAPAKRKSDGASRWTRPWLALVLGLWTLECRLGNVCAAPCTSFRCNPQRTGHAAYGVASRVSNLVTVNRVQVGNVLQATPVQAPDGVILVPTASGTVVAYRQVSTSARGFWDDNPTSFTELWRQKIFSSAISSTPAFATPASSSAPYIAFFASGSELIAMDGSTALSSFSQLWTLDLCSLYQGTGTCGWDVGASSPTVTSDGNTLVLCTGPGLAGACLALSTLTGAARWRAPYVVSSNGYVSSPALSSDEALLVAGSRETGVLHVIRVSDGTRQSQASLGAVITGTPAASTTEEAMYVCAGDGNLYKYDWAGAQQWASPTCSAPPGVQSSPVVLDSGHVVVVSGDGFVYEVDASDGSVRKRLCLALPANNATCGNAGVTLQGSAVYADGLLLAPGLGDSLFALDVSGTQAQAESAVWSYVTASRGGGFASPQLVTSDGVLVLATPDGVVHFVGSLPPAAGNEWWVSVQLRVMGVSTRAFQHSRLASHQTALASALARSSPAIAALPSSQILFTRLDLAPATQQLLLSLAVRSSSSSAATALLSALASSSVLEALRVSVGASAVTVQIAPQAVPDLSPGPSPSPPPSGNNTDPSPPPPPPPPTNPATPFQPEEVYRCATADDCAGSNCPYELCRCSNVGFCIADIPDPGGGLPSWAIVLIAGIVVVVLAVIGIIISGYRNRVYEQELQAILKRRDAKRKRKAERRAERQNGGHGQTHINGGGQRDAEHGGLDAATAATDPLLAGAQEPPPSGRESTGAAQVETTPVVEAGWGNSPVKNGARTPASLPPHAPDAQEEEGLPPGAIASPEKQASGD